MTTARGTAILVSRPTHTRHTQNKDNHDDNETISSLACISKSAVGCYPRRAHPCRTVCHHRRQQRDDSKHNGLFSRRPVQLGLGEQPGSSRNQANT